MTGPPADAATTVLSPELHGTPRRPCLGCLAEGYTVLLDGLRDAEEALAAGADGSEQLVRIYQLALDNYIWRYPVSLESCAWRRRKESGPRRRNKIS